jgi:PEP-CTERM motif
MKMQNIPLGQARRIGFRNGARRGPVKTLVALAPLLLTALPAHATTFSVGEFVTYTIFEYGSMSGSNPTAATLLENNFSSVFAPSGSLQVGVPSPGGFSMTFDSAAAVLAYLPSDPNDADAAPLTADLLDPLFSPSNSLGAEVVAATLNVAFSEAGLLAHPTGVTFGDLVFQNLESLINFSSDGKLGELDGLSVREVLLDADQALGGAQSPFFLPDLATALDLAMNLTDDGGAGDDGGASTFLRFPSLMSAPPVPEPSTWAMMLIGFAGLWFVRSRAMGRRQPLVRSSAITEPYPH